MTKKLSDRQKRFCLYVAEGNNQSIAAIKAGYSEKGNRSRACRLIIRDEIKAEIRRLQEEITTPLISSVLERKQLLSEIARARILDYFEIVSGQLQWKEGADKARAHSIFKIKERTRTDKSGNIILMLMSVKSPDKIRAIRELNKMDGLYRRRSQTKKPDSYAQEPSPQVIQGAREKWNKLIERISK